MRRSELLRASIISQIQIQHPTFAKTCGMRLCMCLVLMGLCIDGMGQKLNVISVSDPYREATLTYMDGEEPLYTGFPSLSLEYENGNIILFDGTTSKTWLYKLDPDLLTIVDSNVIKLQTMGEMQLKKLNESIKAAKAKQSLTFLIDKENTSASVDDLLLKRSLLELRIMKLEQLTEGNMPKDSVPYTKPRDTRKYSTQFGGSELPRSRCKVRASSDEGTTTLRFTIRASYVSPEENKISHFEHRFSDQKGTVSTLSEYQMDVNSKGHLVYLKHNYSRLGFYEGSQLIHCNSRSEILFNKSLTSIADKSSFLIEFENDTLVKIMGIEFGNNLTLCMGEYNVYTNELHIQRMPLHNAEKIGPENNKAIVLRGNALNTIVGYKKSDDGTYIFLTKNEKEEIFNSIGSADLESIARKKQFAITRKGLPWKLRGTSESFYIVKLNDADKIDWINGLSVGSIWVNDICQGKNFPILFNTQDNKLTRKFKVGHRILSDNIGVPLMALVTPEGVRYVEPSFDLLKNECLILTKSCQLDDGEYVGFGAKITSLTYNGAVDVQYKIGVTWHVVRFEVQE